MPELPEVETVRRAMERHLVGRRIARVKTRAIRLRAPLPRKRLHALAGDAFTRARRRAKFLLLDLESQQSLLLHLGMSGNLLLRPPGDKHDHIVFELDSAPPLVFSDPRRFGLVLVLRPGEEARCPHLIHLGAEPLEAAFDTEYLQVRCRGRRRPIKNALMDGRLVAGVGNIYASEALFRAGIHPATPAGDLDRQRLAHLVRQLKRVLRAAIRRGGTTIGDYMGSGSGGRFQRELAVYGRAGQHCLVCERPIENTLMAGRSTFYCPRCQQ